MQMNAAANDFGRRRKMKLPIQISFHNLERIEAVENRILEEAARLDEFCDRIMSCRVVIDVPHRHHLVGNVYQVRIDIKVPGEEIAIVQEPAQHDPFYENVNVAIRDAFNSAARKLEEHVRLQRQDVKHHEVASHGRVSKLFSEGGYGFIETPDGGEVYFHANSVLGGKFDDLAVGTEVVFAEELGDKGPQASTVRILGRHHHIV
jgi:cold shock CspA family protein